MNSEPNEIRERMLIIVSGFPDGQHSESRQVVTLDGSYFRTPYLPTDVVGKEADQSVAS